MTESRQSKEPREDRLNELITEYLRRVDRGEQLDPEQFISPHPDLADRFAQHLREAAPADGLEPSRGEPPELPPMSRDTAASPDADETIPPSSIEPGQEESSEAKQFGRYRLVRLLGQGAMGAVYLAEDPELRRHVALKIPKFHDDQDAAARERFQREARAAATISHPNICQVYDIGEQDGTPFITMAYVQGKSLHHFASAGRQWPEREVAKLARKIAIALAEAHAKGVVHRDLKPGNIMLDQRHEPIVMDFGLAGGMNQPGEEKLTHTGMLLGTPAYMAPEQAEADFAHVGPASDVYSLGVICYELLTGQLPFRGPIAAVIVQIVRDEPRRPSVLRPSLDKRLEAICLKMMAKSPDDRYPTAAEVAAALRQFLGDTATGSKSSSQPTAEASRELEDRKREIVGLLQGGQFGPAANGLEKLGRATGPGSDPYATWARRELNRVRALPVNLLEKGPALVETAIDMIASQQYAEAVELLQAVPADYRSTEADKLLDKATKLQQEAGQLNARMQQAVRTQQYDGLQTDLARLLELQPGNLIARELYDKLATYAPGRPYRFGKDGNLLSAHRTPLLVLLGSTMRQALRGYAQRQKYRRDPAGKRTPTSAQSAPTRPALPILPIAIAAVAFALIVLAIVVLLRDGDQTVRVEIDDALLADSSITLHIDGNEMEIAGLGETMKLTPGDHGYELRRGDELVRSGQFTVLKGDNPALEISLGEGRPVVAERVEMPHGRGEPGFVSLFDGKTLTGWRGDPKLWRVESGAIVGEATKGVHSFLYTARAYKDFTLKMKFKYTEGNTGVSVRGQQHANYKVSGCHADIVGSQNFRLGHLAFDQENLTKYEWTVLRECDGTETARHYRPDDWNDYVITCQGRKIKVELNGYTTVDYVSNDGWLAPEGVIALQLGAMAKRASAAFRDIRIKELEGPSEEQPEPGFVSLFNGRDLSGWHGDPQLWRVVDGTIVGSTTGVDFDAHSYLCTEKSYRDFILKVKFKIREGNSGVQFRSEQLPDYKAAGYQAEIGFRPLPDKPDEVIGLYFQGQKRESKRTSRNQLLQHVNEQDWNEYVITCRGRHITLELNGHRTVDYVENEPAVDEGIIGMQIMRRPKFGFSDMQIEFKDIRIKELR